MSGHCQRERSTKGLRASALSPLLHALRRERFRGFTKECRHAGRRWRLTKLVVRVSHASGYDEENPDPGALVGTWTWDASAGTEIPIDIACFDRPVSLLVFSDGGVNEIGIDNLTVTPVPAPGALLLTLFGLGALRTRRRRGK